MCVVVVVPVWVRQRFAMAAPTEGGGAGSCPLILAPELMHARIRRLERVRTPSYFCCAVSED